ncbi:permease-like cell division protein FtsX [Actinocorallia sp. API 0066]|uniref:permease-like cell division protein FtsX n=1 Tax=Actinocorallia sp. API 0066 TaxID=2896846 RepID=UPI001E4E1A2D|nr:permease-like cell division protein FtsX [Actinocorallia sp. API 0066]MCD0451935.1 permease-like cell division protein FtsX [Actinocorallia sp. API 0066]
MTPTESRLRDALASAAHGIDKVPDFAMPARSRFSRPLAAALVAAATVGALTYLTQDLDPRPAPGTQALTPARSGYNLTAYLCVPTSVEPGCHRRAATPADHEAITATLTDHPGVETFTYESQEAVYARFRALFKDTPGLLRGAKPGDVPDSYRIQARQDALPDVRAALATLPGIDTVVDEPARPGAWPGDVP